MTREEATKICRALKAEAELWGEDEANKALDMAIEALNREQEKFDAICSELVALKKNLNEPIEVAIAYENSIAIVRKYAERF